jgi:putative CocE/NonD family hydrolase
MATEMLSRTFALLLTLAAIGCAAEPDWASFGEYANDEAALFDGSNRYSVYVSAADGTRLAVDYFLPTAEGVEAEGPLPAILHYTRYIRAVDADGEIRGRDGDPVVQHMLNHGYAVVVADARGTGASFGVHWGPFSREETRDSYDVIGWIADQDWCDGNVGMQGRSYPGMTQYQAATQAPPALKAIFAEMAGPSPYDFSFKGGTYKQEFVDSWGQGTRQLDLGERGRPAPVDEDPDGLLVSAAIAEHADNLWAHELVVAGAGGEYRDWTFEPSDGVLWSWDTVGTMDNLSELRRSGVAIYHLAGWYDIYATQQPKLFANLGDHPQKLMVGPWVHSGGYGGPVHRAEILRWYDHWLKGIDNGVMEEDPVHVYVMEGNHTLPDDPEVTTSADEDRAEAGAMWTSSVSWPPSGTSVETWYLAPGPTGTVASLNDGALVRERASESDGRDDYVVDYGSRVGSFSRWMNGHGARREEPEGTTFFDERTAENERALTYTTEPLEETSTILGSAVVHLWASSTHRDGDVFVYLEEVDADGRSHYVSEGTLRLSYRRLGEAPWDNLGLPYHRGFAEDRAELPESPVELVIDLMATGIVLDAGHRIRVTVAGADVANYEVFPDASGADAPTLSIHRGGERASYIELPVMGAARGR